jgi:hypothetical protein
VWSAPGAEWVFNVSTESAEMREAIVTGFVEAIGSG